MFYCRRLKLFLIIRLFQVYVPMVCILPVTGLLPCNIPQSKESQFMGDVPFPAFAWRMARHVTYVQYHTHHVKYDRHDNMLHKRQMYVTSCFYSTITVCQGSSPSWVRYGKVYYYAALYSNITKGYRVAHLQVQILLVFLRDHCFCSQNIRFASTYLRYNIHQHQLDVRNLSPQLAVNFHHGAQAMSSPPCLQSHLFFNVLPSHSSRKCHHVR